MNILIVDDDAMARVHIKTLIQWSQAGFPLLGEAKNGHSALDFVSANPAVDIIITDMSMPVLDGIGLIERLLRLHPHVKVIALSGYSDFQYIRQSMKHGAVDYILKHELTADTLLAALRAAAEKICRERDSSNERRRVLEQLHLGREALWQQSVGQILRGSVSERSSILETIRSLSVPIAEKNLMLIVIEMDDISLLSEKYDAAEIEKLNDSFLDICREAVREFGDTSVFGMGTGKYVVFLSFGDNGSQLYMHTLTSQIIGKVRSGAHKLMNLTASYAVSEWIPHVSDIRRVYEKTVRNLHNRFYQGKDFVIYDSGWSPLTLVPFTGIDLKTEKELARCILSLDLTEARNTLNDVFNRFLASHPPVKTVQMTGVDLVNVIQKLARENGIPLERLFNTEHPYERLQRLETIRDMQDLIANAIEKLVATLMETRSGDHVTDYGRKAAEFIFQHYRKDLSLQMTADEIGISPSYLSRIFKQDFGVGFSEFLNEYRVKQAKTLIESGKNHLKDIVEMTGFNNYNYFFRVFKGVTGMTPAQYEKSLREG